MSGWSWYLTLMISQTLQDSLSEQVGSALIVFGLTSLLFCLYTAKLELSWKKTNKSTVNKSAPTEIDGFLTRPLSFPSENADLELPLEWTNMTSVQEFYYYYILLYYDYYAAERSKLKLFQMEIIWLMIIPINHSSSIEYLLKRIKICKITTNCRLFLWDLQARLWGEKNILSGVAR